MFTDPYYTSFTPSHHINYFAPRFVIAAVIDVAVMTLNSVNQNGIDLPNLDGHT